MLLLVLATTHCVMSIFYVNVSFLNLQSYAHGSEQLPFQGRLLMAPVVRWGEGLAVLQKVAARFARSVPQLEPMSAAKLISLLAAIVSANLLGLAISFYSARLKIRTWWLGWAVLIAILYASYAARYEQALWYPYDLPHAFAFGLATIAIFIDEPLLFVPAFALDVAIRETSIFLLPLALALHFRSVRWRWIAAGSGVLWIASRMLVRVLYPHAAVVHNTPWLWIRYLAPWHLPQLLSIVGFLWVPVLLGRRRLDPRHRLALSVISFTMLFAFYFAVWNETRVWCEWTTAFAILACLELENLLAAAPARVV